MTSTRPRLMILGIDGASFQVTSKLIQAGELPTLARLAAEGSFQPLQSTTPPLTPVAWTTMMTGVHPPTHGIYYFVQGDPADPYVVNRSHVKVPMVWDLLAGCGLRCGLLNIPWTYPPFESATFCISGMDSPRYDERMFHPRELHRELKQNVGIYSLSSVPFDGTRYDISALDDQIDQYYRTARYLLSRYSTQLDVFMIVFMQVDHVQHKFWDYGPVEGTDGAHVDDVISHTYKAVDEKLGMLIDEFAGPDTYILVLSDHGFTGARHILAVNRWLESLGLLAFDRRTSGARSGMSPLRSLQNLSLRLGRKVFHAMPRSFQDFVRRRWWMPARRREVLLSASTSGLDWTKTKVFCSAEYGGLTINYEGTFKNGIVAADERAGLIEVLRQRAKELAHPTTGEPLLGKVRTSEELYGQTPEPGAPELWLVGKEHAVEFELEWLGRQLYQQRDVLVEPAKGRGIHEPEGILLLNGPSAASGATLSDASLVDIAPTVLHLLGVEPAESMDGRPLTGLLDTPVPIRYSKDSLTGDRKVDAFRHSAEDEELIEQRLRDLGYL